MKISIKKLREIVKEELFYREFYRNGEEIVEADQERVRADLERRPGEDRVPNGRAVRVALQRRLGASIQSLGGDLDKASKILEGITAANSDPTDRGFDSALNSIVEVLESLSHQTHGEE